VPIACPREDQVKCPDCNKPTVIEHANVHADGTVARLRRCSCGTKFSTVEFRSPQGPSSVPTEPTFTLRGAAAALGVSPSTMLRYVQRGTIPSVRVGNRWVIRTADVERMTRRSVTVAYRTKPNPIAIHPDAV